jgi:hypothetical protein
MSDDYLARIERVLADSGITTFRIERRRRHRMVHVLHGGKKIMVVIPSSGSQARRNDTYASGQTRRPGGP